MRFLSALLCLCIYTVGCTAPSVLNNNTHAADHIAPAINAALGAGHVDNPLFVDYDPTISGANFVSDSGNVGLSFISVASGSTINHAPYQVLNSSQCCYTPSQDVLNYKALQAQGTLFAMPIAAQILGPLPAGSAPPTLMSTASSANSSNGGTSWGMEFALSPNYLGLDTSADSWVSAEMSGLLASLEFLQPAYNAFDIKAAYRVTAANWATGYDHTQFGYGVINFTAAKASPTLYLQPPGVSLLNGGYYAVVTLLPFRQTRRDHEVLYSVNPAYVWPVKNEYTLADITASGATLLFTSNSTDITPAYTFVPVTSGTVTFTAFTTDGSGHYSRREEFSPVSATLTTQGMCYR